MRILLKQVESMLSFLTGMKPDAIITMPTSWGPRHVITLLLAWRQLYRMPKVWRTWNCDGRCTDWQYKPFYEGGEWMMDEDTYPVHFYDNRDDLREDPNEWPDCEDDFGKQVEAASQYLEWLPSTPDPRGPR